MREVSKCQKSSRAVLGAIMEVTARGGDGGVTDGGPHQVTGHPAVEGVIGVGMPQPVRGNARSMSAILLVLMLLRPTSYHQVMFE